MDQLFDLIPDPIVHHIMSFLTIKHVTKSSILSKRFFFLWSSFPVIDFNESRFARTYQGMPNSLTDAFLDHIHHSILLRKMDTVLSEFRVKADLRSVLTDHRFDHAILFPLENRVKSMNLDLGFSRYYLPSGFVSKWINVLKLKGLSLDLCNLIQDCPSLRTVCLTSCCILRDVKFSSENLIKIELHSCTVKFIEIIAPNVHSFVFDSGKGNRQPCEIDILPCKNISYLSLHNVVNGIDRIEKHVESLGRLKTFILKGCQDLDRIRVWNDKLERLEIGNCPALAFIELITPSLKSFVYKGSNQNRNCIISFLVSKYISDLSIESSNFSDEWLEAQIAKLRWLESLRLKFCYSLKKTKVSHEKLKRVEFVHCPLLAYIELITPALESFVYKGVDHNQFCDINFESSKSIKDFSVKCGAFTDKWLENKIATFTSLESLCLKSCKFLKNIKIYHEKLQILKLNKCIRLVEVEIDTPKLVSFIYRGKMIEFGKIVTRSTCSATLSMKPWIAYNNQSFYRWRQMLSFFGHFKALKLICNSQKELMIPDHLREILVPPLYDLQHLEIHVKSLKKIDSDLVDSLLWLSPLPKTLHISPTSRSSQKMITKFTYEDMTEIEEGEDKNPFCCINKPVKCWRHFLKRVEIQSSDVIPKNISVELQNYFLTNAIELPCFRVGLD